MATFLGAKMKKVVEKKASEIDKNIKIVSTSDEKTQEVMVYLALKNFDPSKSKFSKLLQTDIRFEQQREYQELSRTD